MAIAPATTWAELIMLMGVERHEGDRRLTEGEVKCQLCSIE